MKFVSIEAIEFPTQKEAEDWVLAGGCSLEGYGKPQPAGVMGEVIFEDTKT